MRVLILGGTRFVGRYLVEAARAAGHEVSIFHRGKSGRDLWPDVEDLIGDRETDLGRVLGDKTWDAVVDTSAYVPRVTRSALDVLKDRTQFYAFVSTISVYASFETQDQDESAPLIELEDPTVEQVSSETYGGLKVLCEREVLEHRPDGLIVRPGIVVGPHDYTDRFTYWVDRIASGGRVACPGPPDMPLQFIDARDLGGFVVQLIEARTGGIFNVVGPQERLTFGDCFERIREVSKSDATFEWVSEEALKSANLDERMPLYIAPSEREWCYLFAIDASKARADGLTYRPLEETISDTLTWARTRQGPLSVGLSDDEEKLLLRGQQEAHS